MVSRALWHRNEPFAHDMLGKLSRLFSEAAFLKYLLSVCWMTGRGGERRHSRREGCLAPRPSWYELARIVGAVCREADSIVSVSARLRDPIHDLSGDMG
jgi:hypothetical protein